MADKHDPLSTLATIDEILLDVATIIELSPADRRVAENRYRKLKTHLERQGSPLAPFLVGSSNMIYAQGSIATSTTIVSGTDDERFDVDAVVEIDVPVDWDDNTALDVLEESLQGFPGAKKIIRCTRCVQIEFPFMHMDVTILDRKKKITAARAGEIFHSPDDDDAYRVHSNPWGFTDWFRSNVVPQQQFAEGIEKRRAVTGRSRLTELDESERLMLSKAEQQNLPPAIPSRFDAQEAVALKLLKRFLNLDYEPLAIKRPPSIYLTKITGDIGCVPQGLAAQLYHLASTLAETMEAHIKNNTRPREENPSYRLDKINDRWPRDGAAGIEDMRVFAKALNKLTAQLEKMSQAALKEIAEIVDELFGKRVGSEQRRILKERYTRRDSDAGLLVEQRSGQIYAPAIVRPRETLKEIPRHSFHAFKLDDEA